MAPLPVRIWTALAGTPASSSNSTYRMQARGAAEAGFTISAFPMTRAGMLLWVIRSMGQLKGIIATTTPRGSRIVNSMSVGLLP